MQGLTSSPIYLDYNSTTPCAPEVLEAMLPFFTEQFGNAASKTHAYGWTAEEAVEHARKQIASLIGAHEQEIIFTSGATESINLVIRGLLDGIESPKHIITVATEHKAVLDICYFLERQGVALTTKHGVPFFCDATQAVGKIKVDMNKVAIDMMAFSAHKFYGPKGIGALYIRKRTPKLNIIPLQFGGGHEKKLRSGTLNVPGIVGMGKAAELCMQELDTDHEKIKMLSDYFIKGIAGLNGVRLNVSSENKLAHVVNICFGFPGGDRMMNLIRKHVAVSSGSACSSALVEPSHVLKAMGISDEDALASIRFSFGRFTTKEDINIVIEVIRNAVLSIQAST